MISKSAVCRGPGSGGGKALDVNPARHHVLGGARTRVAVHRDRGMLVHARHVIADVP